MKLYKKEDLEMKNGYIVAKGNSEVVAIDSRIVCQANNLETRYQQAAYLSEQPERQMAPSLNGFERESISSIPQFTCDTPLHDEEVTRSMKLMDEYDSVQTTEKMNRDLKNMTELMEFVQSDSVLAAMDGMTPMRFDTPRLGNPLEWDLDFVMSSVASTFPNVSVDDEPTWEACEEESASTEEE